MLILDSLRKVYRTAAGNVEALKGISLSFRKSEFVSILGPSGCGKTTLLNLIGGLDTADGGEMFIDGVSTRRYKARDWDAYRNHCVGFVFQSYNLIPHQTVLENVELALTLSGVSKKEKRARAEKVLREVGLGDQLHKKPNMLSGGQMQRVAIARALINDPKILLADEPTGALDSETSVQIMELIRSVSRDRLVIMVTHNPELAEKYSTRIVRLADGQVVSDSDPVTETVETGSLSLRHTQLSFFTALSLSLRNLMTKKARTILTAFAGSIGIIGIALILSISNGVERYIDSIESETLGEYPLTIESETSDMQTMLTTMMSYTTGKKTETHEAGKVYSANIISQLFSTMLSGMQENDLLHFKGVIEEAAAGELAEDIATVTYDYAVTPLIYTDINGTATRVNPSSVVDAMYGDTAGSMFSTLSSYSSGGTDVWHELTGEEEANGYTLLSGRWPEEKDEIILFVTSDGYLSDYSQYCLGLRDPAELSEMMTAILTGKEYTTTETTYDFDDILGREYHVILPTDLYVAENGGYTDISQDADAVATVVANGLTLRVVGIASTPEKSTSIPGGMGYTSALSRWIMESVASSDIVQAQLAHPDIDVFTGLAFASSSAVTIDQVRAYLATLGEEELAGITPYLEGRSDEEIVGLFAARMPVSDATYEGNLELLTYRESGSPTTISIYTTSFEAKDRVTTFIDNYNAACRDAGQDEYVIRYTDYVGLLMSSVTTITNTISYVLIAFVSVSLIVSSIMIGVITYISVLERTKEIGILRSIGASRQDISRVFNAETIIVGFTSGAMGIVITLLLTIPINIILEDLTGIASLAYLQPLAAAILVAISIFLTLIAGLIPSRLAARRDPVVALRSE